MKYRVDDKDNDYYQIKRDGLFYRIHHNELPMNPANIVSLLIENSELRDAINDLNEIIDEYVSQTDLGKFVDLYKSFGIDCVVNKNDDDNTYEIKLGCEFYTDDELTTSDKIDGYTGFYTLVVFDKDEKFIGQGVWE